MVIRWFLFTVSSVCPSYLGHRKASGEESPLSRRQEMGARDSCGASVGPGKGAGAVGHSIPDRNVRAFCTGGEIDWGPHGEWGRTA